MEISRLSSILTHPQSVVDTIDAQNPGGDKTLDGRTGSVATQAGGIGRRVFDDFNNQFGLSLKPSDDNLTQRRPLAHPKAQKKKRSGSSTSDQKLKQGISGFWVRS